MQLNSKEFCFEQELNEEQYAAVISQRPTTLIMAGAGTGKTRTLTCRVLWLIEKGVPQKMFYSSPSLIRPHEKCSNASKY
jgi:ATP-dependent exoDNAse (exonuclease V) beta subunit